MTQPLADRHALVAGGSAAHGLEAALQKLGARVEARSLAPDDVAAARAIADARLASPEPLHLLVLGAPIGAAGIALVVRLLPRLLASASLGLPSRLVLCERSWSASPSGRPGLLLAGELHQRVKQAGELRRLRAIAAIGQRAALRAASGPEVRGGECVAPGSAFGLTGAPVRERLSVRKSERALGLSLWQEHEKTAGESLEAALSEAALPGPPPALRHAVLSGPRRISAMLRVRDEEEFLHAAVSSIAGLVDQIVLVDNQSADRTPELIRQLAAEHSDKVAVHAYPHPVARVGSEQAAAARGQRADGVRTLAEYYNWCLARCREPFVLKWDGDMIALDAFAAWLERWRGADSPVLAFRGINVHPDREHLAASKSADREALARGLLHPGVPSWATSLSFDSLEARLYPREQAVYSDEWEWVEALRSPFLDGAKARSERLVADVPCFLHMKLCKRDPWAGYTPELARAIAGNLTPGPALDAGAFDVLRRFQLAG